MKMRLELDKTDIDNAIRDYVTKKYSKDADKVTFKIADTADDRFGGGPNYELISAEVLIRGEK